MAQPPSLQVPAIAMIGAGAVHLGLHLRAGLRQRQQRQRQIRRRPPPATTPQRAILSTFP